MNFESLIIVALDLWTMGAPLKSGIWLQQFSSVVKLCHQKNMPSSINVCQLFSRISYNLVFFLPGRELVIDPKTFQRLQRWGMESVSPWTTAFTMKKHICMSGCLPLVHFDVDSVGHKSKLFNIVKQHILSLKYQLIPCLSATASSLTRSM